MIANLLQKPQGYICSYCRMRQPKPFNSCCYFCDAIFTNYEEELLKIYSEEFKDETTRQA